MMDCIEIIEKFYTPKTVLYNILVDHGLQVAEKALTVTDRLAHLKPDRDFIYESAILHDIGMVYTHVPQLGSFGNHPYIVHGILGRAMLEKFGLLRHAMVCERHIGLGLTVEDIRTQKLPLPLRNMVPVTLEEKIVCYADKFFSKSRSGNKEKTKEEILQSLSRHGKDKVKKFLSWMDEFEIYEKPSLMF
jgi:uncharacterized protein